MRLPVGTPIEVEVVDALSSNTSHTGDKFALRLAAPIVSGGATLAAAGAVGGGEVIDAGHSGMSGSPGKLVVSGRYLELGGRQVRIRAMTIMKAGVGHTNAAQATMLLPYVGVTAMFIKGGESVIPAGTRATAKLAEDIDLQPLATTETLGN